MNWEATLTEARSAGPGWHPDPLDPTRLRWWDGAAWASRIARLEPGSDAISWHADIADLPAPEPRSEAPALTSVTVPAAAVEADAVPGAPPPPAVAAPFTVATPDAPTDLATARPEYRTRKAWGILAAAVTLLLVAGGVSAAMLGDDTRPQLAEPTTAFTDEAADLHFRYPSDWRVDKETPGVGIRFEVSGADAAALETNTVQIKTDPEPAELPALHVLANQTTEQVVAELSDFRLVAATQTSLAGGPAFRLELVDTTVEPVKRIINYVGTTASRRPLYVIVTIREPRTAPTDEELRRLLGSITSS